tara:strand:- start:24879 stop:25139 length:261 start_codon:yes stop_codon:yes gene_type:complete
MQTNIGVVIRIKQVVESFAIRGKLWGEYGITFDTGIDHQGVAEWFLDYSLQYGENIEDRDEAVRKIKEFLDKNKIEYDTRLEEYED